MRLNSHVIKPVFTKTYPLVSHGKGVYLYDTHGKAYLDGCSGAITANIGHGVPEVIAAMEKQANKVSFTYRSQFTSEVAENLAEKLASWAPGDLEYVFFVNSGSEATETAIKIALQYWQEKGVKGKYKILSRWMGYHGITMGSLAVSGHIPRRIKYVPLLFDSPMIDPPYCYRCPFHESYPHCQLPCAEQLEKVIKREGPEYIAAFICEPIIGASGGAIVPPPYYYQRIKQLCDHYGILFIVDEVMTGMGRTGRNFAINHWGVIPDLIALGKGMSAGYAPIAATIVSERIIDVISNGSGAIMAGHTYSAHPQSAAAALAVLDIIEKNQLIQKVAEKGNMLMRELKKIKEAHPIVGDVRGKGFLCGIEFGDFEQKGLSERLIEKAFSLGLLLYPAMGGSDYYGGEGVLVAPPFTLQQEDMNVLLQRLDQALSLLEEDLKHG